MIEKITNRFHIHTEEVVSDGSLNNVENFCVMNLKAASALKYIENCLGNKKVLSITVERILEKVK